MGCQNVNYLQGSLPEISNYFKEEILSTPPQKPDMEKLLDVMLCPEVVNIKLLETPKVRRFERQYLSEANLVIEAIVKEVCNLVRLGRISVTPYIEAVFAKMLDSRTVHKCVMLFVDAKVC